MSRRPRFEARQRARRDRMREAHTTPDPWHRLSPQVLLILGAICTVLAGGLVFSMIDGFWLGVTVFGVLGIATGGAVMGLKATGKIADARDEARWIEADEALVRAEKVEQLGHTVGGVSMVDDRRVGQLSEPEQ